MDDKRNIISIVSVFAAFLLRGCGIVNYLPVAAVEGTIVYLASVLGTLLIWIGRRLCQEGLKCEQNKPLSGIKIMVGTKVPTIIFITSSRVDGASL